MSDTCAKSACRVATEKHEVTMTRFKRDRSIPGLARAISVSSALLCLLCHPAPLVAATNPLGPAAAELGPVAITPTVGVKIEHRDNIYLQEHDATDSWMYIVRPAVNALLQDRENIYQLDYQAEAGWYQVNSNDDKNDYFDQTFSGDAHLEITDRWIAEGYVSWASLHEERGTGLSEGLLGQAIPKPVRYDQADIGGSLQFGSLDGVGRLLLSAGYMDLEYRNFRNLTRTRDRDETSVGGTFFYPVAPKTDLLIEYTYKNIHYPNAFEDAPSLDSIENFLLAGATWEVTPSLFSTAKAGYMDKEFKNSQRKNWDGLGWSLELWMQPREHDTILVQSSRKPEETTLEGNFVKREVFAATWTHDWTDRIYTELAGLYGHDTYEQAINDRKDDIYSATVRAGYEFRRWANFYASYSYDDKNSNIEDLSYTDNVFVIGVDLSL